MTDTLADYFAALERLKKRKAKINNDSVAVEAGRKKGSIKKSRPQFAELIAEIDFANENFKQKRNGTTEQLARAKDSEKTLQSQLDDALARELSLLAEVFSLRKQIAALTGSYVVPLLEKRKKDSA